MTIIEYEATVCVCERNHVQPPLDLRLIDLFAAGAKQVALKEAAEKFRLVDVTLNADTALRGRAPDL